MHSEEIRKIFLEYFKNLDHTIVSSSSVVPMNDPTLLFINAGMNQFKDIFTGKIPTPYNPPRAASVQKCIRVSGKHNDLEEVGHDGCHHTFFEMLGNWSFGDYFKQDAIIWAWKLLTERYNIPSSRLWAAVHEKDDESALIWEKEIGLPPEKIIRCGDKDNFWEMAETGPCGPNTEIHYDWGENIDPDGLPNSSPRFVEIWNIVFMQYFRDETKELTPLPTKNVDTGMGFERLVAVLNGTRDNYETDIFAPIMDRISDISEYEYGENEEIKVVFRVLADHARALVFAIADGAMPGNTGRGYVLRRILRRAARFSRKIGVHNPILWRLVSPLVDKMSDFYPELGERANIITQVIRSEEERFGKTLDYGLELFEKIAQKIAQSDESEISGDDAFKLYDTYGFPLDLTQLMASERGLGVDISGFDRFMSEQRQRARAAGTFGVVHEKKGDFENITMGDDSYSLCYETEVAEAEVRMVRQQDRQLEIVLSHTPFYAESGGQVGDTGTIKGDDFSLQVHDTQREGEHIVHICENVEHIDHLISALREHPTVTAEIDHERRSAIRRNHTSTHLLQSALRQVLGKHIKQAGSLVAPDRLRFDYTHFEAPTQAQISEVERIVNDIMLKNIPVKTDVLKYDEALKLGATALFGEKYGETVRMVSVGDFSKELCGGTHTLRTGDIGLFLIVSEENIGSGIRRIEAFTGESAFDYVQKIRRNWMQIEKQFIAKGDEVFDRIQRMEEEIGKLRKAQTKLGERKADEIADELLSQAASIDDGKLIVAQVSVGDRDMLIEIMSSLEKKVSSGTILLGAHLTDNKVAFVCRVTPDFVQKYGIKAGEIVKRVSQITGGSGGGRPDFAQAGGKEPEKLEEAMEFARKNIAHQLAK